MFEVVPRLRQAFQVDDVVLGGGNSKLLSSAAGGCRRGDNANAFEGGFRLYQDLTPPRPRASAPRSVGQAGQTKRASTAAGPGAQELAPMFLPIGDAPNPKGMPIVTYALIAANVAAFLLLNVPLGSRQADLNSPELREYVEVMARELQGRVDVREIAAQTSAYDLFSFEHGYRPAAPQLTDLVTCMFLHGGFMHLFGNMLFLWIYGDNVERRLGAIPYLLAYLATGAAATLTHALVFSSSDVPLVGASGAISGILGFYFIWFPRNVVRMLAFLPPFLMQVFEIPARWVLGAYLVLDNLLPFLTAGEGGVAHGAHIGGFVAGALAAWVLDRRGAQQPASFAAAASAPSGAEALRRDLAEGRHADAAQAYFALPPALARGALSADEAVELAQWLRGQGHADAALTLLRRAVRDVPQGRGLAEVYAAAGLMLLAGPARSPRPPTSTCSRRSTSARVRRPSRGAQRPAGDRNAPKAARRRAAPPVLVASHRPGRGVCQNRRTGDFWRHCPRSAASRSCARSGAGRWASSTRLATPCSTGPSRSRSSSPPR